jgi:DNA invertase Pin-like site-specific DNA recombinase
LAANVRRDSRVHLASVHYQATTSIETYQPIRGRTAPRSPGKRHRLIHTSSCVLAEEERRMISARTKAALKAAKARGTRLGGQRRKVVGVDDTGAKVYGDPVVITPEARAKGSAVKAEKATARAADIAPTVKALQAAGKTSLRAIADGLNEQGIPTARGQGTWSAVQVARVLERI